MRQMARLFLMLGILVIGVGVAAQPPQQQRPMQTYYEVLGVDSNATNEDIRRAFRRISLKLHPDSPQGNAEKFREAQEARDVLTDTSKRQRYDDYKRNYPNDEQRERDYAKKIVDSLPEVSEDDINMKEQEEQQRQVEEEQRRRERAAFVNY